MTLPGAGAGAGASGVAEEVILEGYLEKLGQLIHTWRRRWFVLTATELKYFEDESKRRMKGHMIFGDSRPRVIVVDDCSRKHPCQFLLLTPARTMCLSAQGDEQRRQWVDIVRTAIAQDVGDDFDEDPDNFVEREVEVHSRRDSIISGMHQ